MKNFFNKALWIAFIVLSPTSLIGLLSQNSIPGEFLYPVKLSIEKAGLIVFSLTPESHATYNTSLTERRFDEATTLLVQNSNSAGLATLVEQTTKAAESTAKIEDPEQKKKIEEKLVQDIVKYQEKLAQIQQQVGNTQPPQDTGSIPQDPKLTPTIPPAPQIPTQEPTKKPRTSFLNNILPKSPTPTSPIPVHSTTPSVPTPTPVPPTTTQTPSQIVENIETTNDQLEEIIEQIQQNALLQPNQYQQSQPMQQDIPTPSATTRPFNPHFEENPGLGDPKGLEKDKPKTGKPI